MNAPKMIPVASPVFMGNEKTYLTECIDSGWISSNGRFIKTFEENFAQFCGTQYALSCANGTVALHLALLAFDVQPGDEILLPTLTYVASANAVTYCGARPVFIDSEAETGNLDPALIEPKITEKTKGIIVVHLYGHPVDMDAVSSIAKKHGLFVIEDAAEAHGATYKERMIGTLGDIATFSFYGNKIITTGEGGMVVTSNQQLAEKMLLLKGQGMDPQKRYWFPVVGYNYRMTNMQAAIGLAQLENISWHLEKRKEIARIYSQYLDHLKEFVILPVEKSWANHAFWMYSIILKDHLDGHRDQMMTFLAEQGIETRPFFYPMHQLPMYQESPDLYPVAETLSRQGMNLPTHGLLQEADIAYIAQSIEKYCYQFA
jgi:perosamine synthetase